MSLSEKIRLLLAEWCLNLAVTVVPATTKEGRLLLTNILRYIEQSEQSRKERKEKQ